MRVEHNLQNRLNNKLWLISILVAAIISVGGLLFSFGCEEISYSVVMLGDSLIGNLNDGEGVAAYLEKRLEVPVLKAGFGGSRVSYSQEDIYPTQAGVQLSLVQLSKAIAIRDFSTQISVISYGNHYSNITLQTLNYFEESIQQLSITDFDQVKYLVIEHGTNDYNSGVRLDNPDDPYDASTFGGGMRSAIERIEKAYPEISIILMTPTWCYITYGETQLYCDEMDFGGGLLEEYVALELEIAEEYGVTILDNYHESGINANTADTYLIDGLHLNRNGQELIAERLEILIRELEKEKSDAINS